MTLRDIDHKDLWDNFQAWYNTVGKLYIPNEKDAWSAFQTVLAHEWKHYAD